MNLRHLIRNWRYVSGAIIWCAVILLVGNWLNQTVVSQRSPTSRQLLKYITHDRRQVALEFERPQPVRAYDPIFWQTEQGRLVQVGAIERTVSPQSGSSAVELTDWARAEFFSNAPRLNSRHYLIYYQTPQSMDFVLRTMLPPEKRKKIAELIGEAFAVHRQELLSSLKPILERGLQDAAQVIQEEFHASLERHREELRQLGAKYHEELVKEKIIPLISREIWPIVRREAEPLLNRVGEEMWQEASVWRFGWAFIYDAAPLPRRDLAKKEFNRFVNDKAIPILTSYIPEFVSLQQRILREISQNPKVLDLLQRSFQTVAEDPEVQKIALLILKEVFLENERLREVVEQHFSSPETQALLRTTDQRLEPTVQRIGELLFGNPKKEISREFNQVLRAKVLLKDHRWFLLVEDGSFSRTTDDYRDPLPVVVGAESQENPTYYPVRNRD